MIDGGLLEELFVIFGKYIYIYKFIGGHFCIL